MTHPTTRRARGLALATALVATALATPATATATPRPDRPERPERCALATEQAADSSAKHSIESGGRERDFVLRLPRGYEKRSDWPLVVALHGRGSTGVEVEGYSELSTLPAVVAYPDGVADPADADFRKAWQGAPYEVEGVDDVDFVEDLLDELQTTRCVDTRRTYVTGKSNGGGLAALLTCRLPDRFAGAALVASALYPGTQEDCADASPVPTLVIHGVADATIPFAGDERRGLPDVRTWLAARAERDGCEARPRQGRIGRDVLTSRWRHCDDGSELRLLAVEGGGHVWPGARVYSGGGHVTRTISAHQQAWAFFTKHRLASGTPQEKGDAR